jgi:hypothetical protein
MSPAFLWGKVPCCGEWTRAGWRMVAHPLLCTVGKRGGCIILHCLGGWHSQYLWGSIFSETVKEFAEK